MVSGDARSHYTETCFTISGRGGWARQTPGVPAAWRNPPLAGLRYSTAPFHDGRTESLVRAIERHGGRDGRAVRRLEHTGPYPQGESSCVSFYPLKRCSA